LSNLKPGTYFWSVQAIDTAFAGSAFATEGSFSVSNNLPFISPVSNISIALKETFNVPIVVSDTESPGDDLVLTAFSSNTNLVPNQTVLITGSGTNRTLQLKSGLICGSTMMNLTLRDGAGAYTNIAFAVTVRQFTLVSSGLPDMQSGRLSWADYDNDGDLDVFVLGVTNTSGTVITRLYRNLGNGTFTNSNLSFPAMAAGAVAWADYDRDGYVDFVLTGAPNGSTAGATTQLYHNNTNGTFSAVSAGFAGTWDGAVAWGDYDNDGDPDLLVAGRTSSNGTATTLYRNNGNGTFTSVSSVIGAFYSGAIAWGDYDNDGDLDIAAGGVGLNTTLYRNNGNGTFNSTGIALPIIASGSLAWGDYDNDGDVDLLIASYSGSAFVTRVYRNNGAGTFANDSSANLPAATGNAAWGDFDNDGFLDVLLSSLVNAPNTRVFRNAGIAGFQDIQADLQSYVLAENAWADYDQDGDLDFMLVAAQEVYGYSPYPVKLYRNENAVSNTPPSAPTGLATTVSNKNVTFTWTRPADAQTTNANGLSYSLRVGTTPGGGQVRMANAAPADGFRLLNGIGAITTNRWFLQNLAPGTYYWAVQAIDTAFAGSPFSTESMFVITNTRPTANSQSRTLGEDTTRAITLSGSDADGQTLTYAVQTGPTNGSLTGTPPTVTYRPITNYFGTDSFSFQAFDGMTNSPLGIVSLTITQVTDVATVTLSIQQETNGSMRLMLVGEPYETYVLQTSPDLLNWTPLSNLLFTNILMQIKDETAPDYDHRFYRLMRNPSP
jgi:hypothetical protein